MKRATVSELPPALQEQVRAQIAGSPSRKPPKYRNSKTVVDGIIFDSRLEARLYDELKLRRAAGEVSWFVRQVPFRLPGRVVYRCDFLAVLTAGGVEVLDAKGFLTASSLNKIRQVEELYGLKVKLWPQR